MRRLALALGAFALSSCGDDGFFFPFDDAWLVDSAAAEVDLPEVGDPSDAEDATTDSAVASDPSADGAAEPDAAADGSESFDAPAEDASPDGDTSDVPAEVDASDASPDGDTSDVPAEVDASDARPDGDTSDVPAEVDASDVRPDGDTSDVRPDADTSDTPDGESSCGVGVTFTGQVGGVPPGGGTAVFGTRPWSTLYPSGNLAAALAAVPPGSGVEIVEADADVVVTRARVVATSFGDAANQSFVVADRFAAMRFYLPIDGSLSPPFAVAVGQDISFRVTRVQRYDGRPTILQARGFALLSEGNAIGVDNSGRAFTAADVNQIVSVTGVLTADRGDCGGAMCYALTYGAQATTLRTRSTFAAVGQCVTFVGPVSTYDDDTQLDTTNFDWVLFY